MIDAELPLESVAGLLPIEGNESRIIDEDIQRSMRLAE